MKAKQQTNDSYSCEKGTEYNKEKMMYISSEYLFTRHTTDKWNLFCEEAFGISSPFENCSCNPSAMRTKARCC
jgi:hypothetical protein